MKYEEYNFDTTGYPKEMMVWLSNKDNARKRLVLGKAHSYYITINNEGSAGSWPYAKDLPNTKPRTIKDGLQYGDIIKNGSLTRKVLGICGDVYLISSHNNTDYHGSSFTLKELIDKGYILKQPEESKEIVELTIEDIAKLKGVDPSTIRVKE